MFPEDYLTDQPERVIAASSCASRCWPTPATSCRLPPPWSSTGSRRCRGRREERRAEGAGAVLGFCSILVDRESQKPILIGRAGDMIKRIGTAARLELERFFATRVFLDLQVKVRPDWRENERVLDDIGVERGRPRPSGRRPRPAGKCGRRGGR